MARKKSSSKALPPPARLADTTGATESLVDGDAAVTSQAVDLSNPAPTHRFPIVGIGASAGGLAAFEAFFSAIPAETRTGMAFVLVQHLAPDHASILTELVQRYTGLRVLEVTDGLRIEPDGVYIIPPGFDMALFQGVLHLLEPTSPHGLRLPIDFFFRSLAQDQHERAIGVVLSGTGSDGTLGARAIKGEGGLVLAQAPKTAAFDGMPRSVIATGLVDFTLPPAEMPAQIMVYVGHAFNTGVHPLAPAPQAEDILSKICILLRDQAGHDFSQYKPGTLVRRIARRMALHQITTQGDYVRYLQQDPVESTALFRDLLIGVTNFFRDPDAFAALQQDGLPRLFAGKPAGATVRVWCCGCSTGEEAYSLAILLQESLETLRQPFKIQMFATDIDSHAITQARSGVYPISIAADVTPERLERFFCEDADAGVYRIQKSIRDLLVFSEQDVIRDPPFSRLDLISCRNLLIYLNSDLQRRLIPLFHYALNPGGVLFLGKSEGIGESLTLFAALNRKEKVYVRREQSVGVPLLPLPMGEARAPFPADVQPPVPPRLARDRRTGGARTLTEQALLRLYAPVSILVNGLGEILHLYGRTGQYLEPTPGDPVMNLLRMAREGLRHPLTMALQRAVTHQETVRQPGLLVKTNGDFTRVNLTVHPPPVVSGGMTRSDLYLVVLEPTPPTDLAIAVPPADETGTPNPARDARVAELELELRAKEEYLQSILEERETANEELKSTNEEMQSVNEELQSTNEELETSKEELQSVNEELVTVNAELQTKVADLSHANDDMNNLLAGTGIATLFVDHQLRITRFTPSIIELINMIHTDVGRPVSDLSSNFMNYQDFIEDIGAVLQTLAVREHEVQTRQGMWYLMRIGPYRTLNHVIEGAVITFVDISGRKQIEEDLRTACDVAEGIVDVVREPLVVLDPDLRVVSANRAFIRYFRLNQREARNPLLFELGDGQWTIPELRQRLVALQSSGTPFDDLVITADFPRIGPRTLRFSAHALTPRTGPAVRTLLLAIDDQAPSNAGDASVPAPMSTDGIRGE